MSPTFFLSWSRYCYSFGVADIDTIRGSIRSAKRYEGKVMVDLINVDDKMGRPKEILMEGDIYLGIHTGIDQQNRGESPLAHLKRVIGTELSTIC